jgi:predicted amidohydrolase YtcJ
MKVGKRTLVATVLLLALAFSGPRLAAAQAADIVFHNARVVTMDDARPSAAALAVRGERIVSLGSYEDVLPLIGPATRVHDLGGRTIIPGINETHIHLRDLGFEQRYAVNLQPANSIADVQRLLSERLAELQAAGTLGGWRYPTTGEQGPWLFGLAWTADRLAEGRMTTRQELDAVSREVPISLDRIYQGLAINTRVFELLGIRFEDPSTHPDWFRRDPPDFEAGDIIFRDPETGLPTGVFMGMKAPALVSHAVPHKTFEQEVESLVLGLEYLASLGITSVVEPGSRMGAVTRHYQAAYNAGRLPIRAVVYDGWYRSGDPSGIGDPEEIRRRVRALGVNNIGDHWFRLRGIKSSEDGGVGARSGTLSVPFLPHDDDPLGDRNFGMLREPDAERRLEQFRILAEHGWELHTHAIGDVAIRRVVDMYVTLLDSIRAENPAADLRWSIIHLYLPDEPGTSVLQDMARHRVIAAINPANLYFEGDSFVRNIGPERMARLTPYRTLLDAGILMASGSDYPNNSPDPWAGIYQMITRRHDISGEVHGPEQRIPLLEALKTFTINGAYLTYDENQRGSLAAGKLADLVILDADLLEATDDEILDMASKVMLTMVGGRVAYQRDAALPGR